MAAHLETTRGSVTHTFEFTEEETVYLRDLVGGDYSNVKLGMSIFDALRSAEPRGDFDRVT